MAVDKLVDSALLDAALGDIADVIRSKTGISGSFDFPTPNDIAEAIDFNLLMPTGTKTITENGTDIDVASYAKVDVNVSGGGGYTPDEFNKKLISGDIKLTDTVNTYRFNNMKLITGLEFEAGTDKSVANNGFSDCTGLKKVFCKGNPIWLGTWAFGGCTSLEYVVNVFTLQQSSLSGCTSLMAVDVGTYGSSGSIAASVFNNDSAMATLVIRRTNSVVSLANINAFNGTPFASGKAGGTLYVPNSLISSYQSASNWSTILGYTNNQIKSIESTHTDPTAPIDLTLYYADGTPISS